MTNALLLFVGVFLISVGVGTPFIEAADPERRMEQSEAEGVKIEKDKAIVQRGYKVSKDGDKAVITRDGETKPVTILQCACLSSRLPCGMIVEPSEVRCENNRHSFQCSVQDDLCHVTNVIHTH